jgi:tRNA U55 pseudouridine synthase TruB
MGKELGCGAFLEILERTRSGAFMLSDSIGLETMEKTPPAELLKQWVITPGKALSLFPSITLDEEIARRVAHGGTVTYGDLLGKGSLPHELTGRIRLLNQEGEVLAMAQIENRDSASSARDLTQPAWKLLRVFKGEK